MKSGLWLSRRQVRWLIVLLALLPLIPSGLLIQIMVQNAIRDRLVAETEMARTYQDQLFQVADRFSAEQETGGEEELVAHLDRVFGDEVHVDVSGPGKESLNHIAANKVVYRIPEGVYAGWTVVMGNLPGLPEQMEEQRRQTVTHVVGILLGVLLVAAGVWFTVHRRLRVDELRSDLLTTISHEIKTPVAATKVLIETLSEGDADEATTREYLELIGKENDRMTELADQFLTYSRLEQGQVQIARRSCNLSRLLQEQVILMRPPFEAAGGELELVCKDSWNVETDPQAVKLILMNLFENALKYGGDPPTCLVEAKRVSSRIEIWVSDSGEGVARSERRAIFRKFYQSDAELSHGRSGVGLGLPICRHFARLLRGEVYVADSREGDGAKFVLTLPAKEGGLA